MGLCTLHCTITVFLIYWTDNNHNLKSRLPILQISGPNGTWMLKKAIACEYEILVLIFLTRSFK